MVRIIHLSDFHLNPRTLVDWNDYVKVALLKKLKEYHTNNPITFIAFTGDAIDIGGADYADAQTAFKHFKAQVIEPILSELDLGIDRFLIIPGNHDIVRAKDNQRAEIGLKGFLQLEGNNVNSFIRDAIENNDFDGIRRMEPFSDFINDLYSGVKNCKISIFGSSFIIQNGSEKIGICCLNSSWRCYGKNDINNLFIGEAQLSNSLSFILNTDIKIALVHHPLDWLSEKERGIITNHIVKDFDILLLGHVHETKTSMHTGFNGTLFINMAPSGLNDIRSDSRTFANGFTIIEYNKGSSHITCSYWRYNHSFKEFVLNTDAVADGIYSQEIPNVRSRKKTDILNRIVNNVREDHFQFMDNHMIGVKDEVIKISIKDAFILPPIDEGEVISEDEEKHRIVSLSEILKSKYDLMFFGSQETGKTTLLYRLVREYIDEFEYINKIPVYINFEEIGNKEFVTCIKEYLRASTEDVRYLLESNQIVLLLDNLKYKKNGSNKDQINKFHRLKDSNQDLQVIATSDYEITGVLSTDYIELCKVPFKNYFIRHLGAKEIKHIIKIWLPNEESDKSEDRLDKLVKSFQSYVLPSSAMSVSLFLWSSENKERKPINHAVLMEIYIELTLEKLNKENVYRKTFDFTNKMQLLAKIAQEMLVANEVGYSIVYSKFVKIIEKYLKQLVGFDYETDVIINYFLSRKIFIRYQAEKLSRIKFSYSCFFNFFLAKRMEYDNEFRLYVLEEDNYYNFIKEIDYYTGLTRSDEALFKLIYERFEKEFAATEKVLTHIDIDSYFGDKGKPFDPVVKKVEINKIKDSRPTVEKTEEYYNKILAKIPDPGKIINKNTKKALDNLLLLMCNVLRNSEGVENKELKKRAYDSIIKYSMTWMIYYRAYLIDNYIKNKKIPPIIATLAQFDLLLTTLPFNVQYALNEALGTPKLAPIILEKIKEDNYNKGITNSDIESYLSIAFYSDIEGKDFAKYLKSFVKRVGNNPVKDYLFYKLIYYYYRRTKTGSPNEAVYLDILAELKIRTGSLPQQLKQKIIKSLKDGKKAFKDKTSF